MVKSMSPSLSGCLNTENSPLHRGVPEQQTDPMHRANELRLTVAPTHASRDWKVPKGLLHKRRHQLRRGSSARKHTVCQPFALVCSLANEILDSNPAGAGEPFRRFARCPVWTEGGRKGRSSPRSFQVRLAGCDSLDQQREAARGGEALNVCKVDRLLSEPFADPVGEGCAQLGQGDRRQFLGTNFDQQVTRCVQLPPPLVLAHREAEGFPALEIDLGHGPCQGANTQNEPLALGHRDRASRIQEIEGVGRLEHLLVGR